jgi:hypothetical protein
MQALVHRHDSPKRGRASCDILDDLVHMGINLDALPETLEENFMMVCESFSVELGSGLNNLGFFASKVDEGCEPADKKRLRVE